MNRDMAEWIALPRLPTTLYGVPHHMDSLMCGTADGDAVVKEVEYEDYMMRK